MRPSDPPSQQETALDVNGKNVQNDGSVLQGMYINCNQRTWGNRNFVEAAVFRCLGGEIQPFGCSFEKREVEKPQQGDLWESTAWGD
ncbi:hypothetical protein TNCV_1504581 [Trichonephila clavipes]|uniref:Uncharacterized protein n=1 Tax=Trichonephila clavipes TaxID=2585209 RepID=A0A8X6V8K4_TRICX|nr:hypothetical protein TNCV_1504581 [Trichonephila clavipes]